MAYDASPSLAGISGTLYSTKYLTIQARTREAFRQTATVCTQRCASYCFLTASRQPIVNSTAATSMTTNDTLAPSGVATPSNPAPWRRSLTSPPHRHGPTSATVSYTHLRAHETRHDLV